MFEFWTQVEFRDGSYVHGVSYPADACNQFLSLISGIQMPGLISVGTTLVLRVLVTFVL